MAEKEFDKEELIIGFREGDAFKEVGKFDEFIKRLKEAWREGLGVEEAINKLAGDLKDGWKRN